MTELEGTPSAPGQGRVALIVSRYNELVTGRLLDGARTCLREYKVPDERVDLIWTAGAFELPAVAAAAASGGRYGVIIAIGCVMRGETPHFDLIAHESASGLQLAAIETGVPVAFGVLTVENRAQAEERIDKAAEAVRSALEMADVFSQLRASAAGPLH